MKQRRTVGESAKSVREQVFMWRYKSKPSIVESSVSKSSACCRYCQSCPWSVAKNWEELKMFSFFYKEEEKVYLAVTCVFASFPQSGCFWDGCYLSVCLLPWFRLFRDGCYLCVCLLPWVRLFKDGWNLCVCLLPWVRLFRDGCYLCVCLLPWVRLFRDGCYLCVCLLPWQVAVTCVFASFPDRWLWPVFLPSSLSQVVWRWLLPMFLPPSLTEVAVTSCLLPSMNQVIQTPRWLLPVFLPPSLRLSQRWLRDGSYLCFAVGVCVFQVHLVHHPRGCWHIAHRLLPQVPHLQHGQQVSTASLVSLLDCEQTILSTWKMFWLWQ